MSEEVRAWQLQVELNDANHKIRALTSALQEAMRDVKMLKDAAYYNDNQVRNLESTIEYKDIEIDKLMTDTAELTSYIKELEDALAEAHLTGIDEGAIGSDTV